MTVPGLFVDRVIVRRRRAAARRVTKVLDTTWDTLEDIFLERGNTGRISRIVSRLAIGLAALYLVAQVVRAVVHNWI